MKLATNGSAGAATSSCARPELEQPPVDEHADPPGERGRVLEVVRHEQRREAELARGAPAARRAPTSACARRARRAARRGAGRPGRARAHGRARPAGARRPRARPAARRRGARSRSARAARRAAAARAVGDVPRARTGAGRARSPGTRARPSARSGGSATPRSLSSQTRSPSAIRPRSGRTSPAIARSTLVLPAPEGPTSATIAVDLERYLEGEGAERKPEVEGESVQCASSLTASRIATLTSDEQAADRERGVEAAVELRVDRRATASASRPGGCRRT